MKAKALQMKKRKKFSINFTELGNAATKGAKGTGLGLYLTKKIIQNHNGEITVNNNTPSGCIFTVTLHSSEQKN